MLNNYYLCHTNIWGAAIVLLAYAFSLYVIVRSKEHCAYITNNAVMLSVMTIFIAYFPVSFYFLYTYMPGEWANYMEINSLFFIPWVIAAALAVVISSIKNAKRICFMLVLGLFSLVMWNWGRDLPEWEKHLDWYYRIPYEAIEIGDYIGSQKYQYINENKYNTVKVLVLTNTEDFKSAEDRDEDYVSIQYRIGNSLRQYMSPIVIEPENIEPYHTQDINDPGKYDYVVCTNDSAIRDFFEEKHFALVKDYGYFLFMEKELF